ncbi:MAG TPA: SAM-dependent methyltransferase [Ohtaekwangia sp.]|uniref:class I SAM-dependent methyltransferase n=1 Tax=Ohtaekwangia sp. TaxID=2066019 RepID=UPI002F93AD32
MTIEQLLQPQLQQFIHEHAHDDERELVLKYREIEGVPSARVAEQIAGRRKAKDKLPSFYSTPNILYPPGINLEQSSSEQTGAYKVKIIKNELVPSGVVVDLTGGFGVDSFFLSKYFEQVQYIEPAADLLAVVKHNHKMLRAENILHHHATAEVYLQQLKRADLVYIDPSRRSNGQKVFRLSDCLPDVVALHDLILTKADTMLVKTSPLLDIQQGIKELKTVKKVFIVSVSNECKELLFLCTHNVTNDPEIIAVNLLSTRTEEFSFTIAEEQSASANYNPPLEYLYEPNASLLKAGAFKIIADRYNIFKIHPSTHLYTSAEMIADFPGRVFKIQSFVKGDKKEMTRHFPEGKANVTTRNYPLSPEELKKKTGLKDGGDKFLIGFSGKSEKFLVAAERIIHET